MIPGTDVPVHELLRYLRGGYTVEQFVEDHPSAERHRVVSFLAEAVEGAVGGASGLAGPDPHAMADNKSEVMRRLREHADAIRGYGVRRLALFGSFARGENAVGSDVDVLAEFEPGTDSFRALNRLTGFLEVLLGRRVEVITPAGLSPYLGPRILAEAEDVALAA